MKNIHDVGIIGAGISGLSIAYYLKKNGLKTCLFEKSDRSGGVITSKNINGFICEEGPNTIVLNNPSIKNLIEEINLSDDIIDSDESVKYKYFLHKNNIVPMPLSFNEFIFSPLLNFFSKVKIICGLFFIKDVKSKTIYNFFKNNFGEQFHDNIIEPFLNGIYAGNTKKIYFEYALPGLWGAIKKNRSLVCSMLFNNKSKKNKTISFTNGNIELINKLTLENKNNINYLCEIEDINFKNKCFEIKTKSGEIFKCYKIVSTIAIDILIKALKYKPKYLTKEINYNPIDVYHISFNSDESHKIPKGFGILSKKSEKKSFLGILFSSFIFPSSTPSGKEMLTVLSGGAKNKNILKKDINYMSNITKDEIKDLLKINSLEIINKKRWFNAIPSYGKEIKNIRLEIKNIEKKFKDLHIIGNYYNGVSVSSCVEIAKKKSEKIIKNGNQNRK